MSKLGQSTVYNSVVATVYKIDKMEHSSSRNVYYCFLLFCVYLILKPHMVIWMVLCLFSYMQLLYTDMYIALGGLNTGKIFTPSICTRQY